jgi:ionotropic glutamate receptor
MSYILSHLGEKLHIRVIDAPPFVMFWNKSSMIQHQKPLNINYRKTENEDIEIYGYVADLINELEKKMGFMSTIDPCPSDTPYNTLVESVSINDTWDIVISDITITSKRLSIVDFSLPIYENALRIVIRDSPSFSISFLSYLRPFSLEVWLSIVGTIIYSGLLVYLFEQQTIEETEDYRGHRAVIFGIYQALSSIVGMGGDFQLRTKSSRIIVVGLFTVSIILVATYTANLSSFLTLQRSQPVISGIDDIKNGRLPFHRVGILDDSATVEYYTQNVSTIFYPVKSINDMYTLLLDNRIDAAIENAIGIEYTVDHQYCGRLSVIGVGFAKSSFGIAMAKNWRYKNDLDKTIVSLREEGKLELLEQKWFSERICNSKNHGETWQQDGIPMTVMTGLFVSFLVVSAMAFALHLYHFRAVICKNCKEKIGLIIQTARRLI